MDSNNPYASPESEQPPAAIGRQDFRARRTTGLSSRYWAASIDALLSIIGAICVAKAMPEDSGLLQCAALVGTWLGYFLFFELLFSSSIGKLIMGLVVQSNGDRITWRHAAIRTLFRLLEANPIFLGALPAAICVLVSPRHQRFGDMVAGTIVVKRAALRRRT